MAGGGCWQRRFGGQRRQTGSAGGYRCLRGLGRGRLRCWCWMRFVVARRGIGAIRVREMMVESLDETGCVQLAGL